MKELVQTDTFAERRHKLNQYVISALNLSSFSIVYPNATYQGVLLTIVGGNYKDSTTSAVTFIADTILTLTASSDNYVYVDKTTNQILTSTTDPASATTYVVYKVTLNEFEEISGVIDYRTWLTI
jgi:hypothetical protein